MTDDIHKLRTILDPETRARGFEEWKASLRTGESGDLWHTITLADYPTDVDNSWTKQLFMSVAEHVGAAGAIQSDVIHYTTPGGFEQPSDDAILDAFKTFGPPLERFTATCRRSGKYAALKALAESMGAVMIKPPRPIDHDNHPNRCPICHGLDKVDIVDCGPWLRCCVTWRWEDTDTILIRDATQSLTGCVWPGVSWLGRVVLAWDEDIIAMEFRAQFEPEAP